VRVVTRTHWSEFSSRTRRLIVIAGAFDAVVRAAALVDLARRPAPEVRGSKRRWAFAVVLINSVGIAPLAYFVVERKRAG
jgi:hypothetical protein